MDEGRLELDDDGRVVEPPGTSASPGSASPRATPPGPRPLDPVGATPTATAVVPVDLDDADATEQLDTTPLDGWVRRSAAPWVGRHRRLVSAVAAVAVAAGLAGGWAASRPSPPPPAPLLALADAPVVGADLGGPSIDADGRLSVAYWATPGPDAGGLLVYGIEGPGLRDGVLRSATAPLTPGRPQFLQLDAATDCDDPALATATPASYALVLHRPPSAATAGSTQSFPFDAGTTDLRSAVRDHCLVTSLPRSLSVQTVALTGHPGSSVVDVSLLVRNDSGVPATVATERTPSSGVEVDLSPTVLVAQHGVADLRTRVLVHDCASPAVLPALGSLPNPVTPTRYADAAAPAGLTLRIGIGDRTALTSLALPEAARDLAARLRDAGCQRPARIAATVTDVRARAAGGGWDLTATLRVRTTGIGVTVGREHFTGPPDGQGSVLTTPAVADQDASWRLEPTRLDYGAGHVGLHWSGASCDTVTQDAPATVAVRVSMADGSAVPYEVPVDGPALVSAVQAACRAG
ncbi:MAG: hypothetical protein GC157_15230 [Frankiales bacterium]|nr:hypothetical protein [Frankiales bacterium]